MLTKQQISSKIAIAGLILLLVFLGDLKYQQWQNQKEIEKQKNELEQTAQQLEKKNEDLTGTLQLLNSESFKERVARDQLGLKKTGEQVYSFTDAPPLADASNTTQNISNAKKWWNYFFAD